MTYRDADTVDTEITKTQDTRTVCNDADLWVLELPVLQHGPDRLALLDGDVKSLGAGVEGGVLQADIADGRCVDKGHKVADVVHEEAVEEVHVLVLDCGQVEVLVDVGLAAVNHLHGASALGLEALHGVGDEAGEVLADSLLRGEREACVSRIMSVTCPPNTLHSQLKHSSTDPCSTRAL